MNANVSAIFRRAFEPLIASIRENVEQMRREREDRQAAAGAVTLA